jgi:hypothetical protein
MSFEAPMSYEQIPCFAAGIPGFPRSREFTPNMFIFHPIKPRRHPEKGKFDPIFANSLLNSLLYSREFAAGKSTGDSNFAAVLRRGVEATTPGQKWVLQTSLRAALFAPRSNPESEGWTLDCFGAKRRLAMTDSSTYSHA